MNRVCSGPGPPAASASSLEPASHSIPGAAQPWSSRKAEAHHGPPASSTKLIHRPDPKWANPAPRNHCDARQEDFQGCPGQPQPRQPPLPSASPALPHCPCSPGRPTLQPSPWEPGHFQESTSALASRLGHAVSSARNPLLLSWLFQPSAKASSWKSSDPPRQGRGLFCYIPSESTHHATGAPSPPSQAAKVWGP